MYIQGDPRWKFHREQYGHQSTNGFKDVIHIWKAQNFDPDKLLKFYKDNGAMIPACMSPCQTISTAKQLWH